MSSLAKREAQLQDQIHTQQNLSLMFVCVLCLLVVFFFISLIMTVIFKTPLWIILTVTSFVLTVVCFIGIYMTARYQHTYEAVIQDDIVPRKYLSRA
jgi:membrane protein YdbS with pleckstrin-like domain